MTATSGSPETQTGALFLAAACIGMCCSCSGAAPEGTRSRTALLVFPSSRARASLRCWFAQPFTRPTSHRFQCRASCATLAANGRVREKGRLRLNHPRREHGNHAGAELRQDARTDDADAAATTEAASLPHERQQQTFKAHALHLWQRAVLATQAKMHQALCHER